MSNINLTCDVCGREVQGYTWNNGMKFCAKCYQETFESNTSRFVELLNKEMYELKIATLENKLAEKDLEIARLKAEIATLPAHDEELIQITREKICNEVRQEINECDWVLKGGFYYIKQIELNDKIDQIEEFKKEMK